KMKMIPFIICFSLLFSCGKKDPGSGGGQAPPPAINSTLSIGSVSMERADNTTKSFIFVVNVENPNSQPITVQYTTVDGTAKAGVDYTASNGTLTIAANQHNATIPVTVTANDLREADKIFYVQLSNPSNAKLSGASKGTGTIICNGTR